MAELPPGHAGPDRVVGGLDRGGHLIPSGVPGVYGRGSDYEDVRGRFDAYVTRVAVDAGETPEVLRFPPVLPRKQIEELGYLENFPHLAGSVFAFEGKELDARAMAETAGAHGDWSGHLHQSELCLTPAVCYPVYPAIARRGDPPRGRRDDRPGRLLRLPPRALRRPCAAADVPHARAGPDRRAGGRADVARPAGATARWQLLLRLGLDAEFDVANDPFFGRSGRMMAASQREQALKFEILVQIAGDEPTAIASFNYHQDHFTGIYGIETADGGRAHTACLGFGHERIVLALMKTHGLDVAAWPDEVRRELW